MAHTRKRTGYVVIVLALRQICKWLLEYRAYQATIQTEAAMGAWDGLMVACETFLELVVDPRTI